MKTESHMKSAAKALSWRITASSETMLLGWLVTGSWKAGLSIASIEMVTKFFLYYAHERAWVTVPAFFRKHRKPILGALSHA